MTLVTEANRLKDHDQPTINTNLWVWPSQEGRKKKTTEGQFSNHLVIKTGNTASNTGGSTNDGDGADALGDGQKLGPLGNTGGSVRVTALQSVILGVSVVVFLIL